MPSSLMDKNQAWAVTKKALLQFSFDVKTKQALSSVDYDMIYLNMRVE